MGLEYTISNNDKNEIRYIESLKSFRERLETFIEDNPDMTYDDIAKKSYFSEYDIRRTLGLIQ